MKIKCYFPDDLEKDQDPLEITRVHGINPIQSTEYSSHFNGILFPRGKYLPKT